METEYKGDKYKLVKDTPLCGCIECSFNNINDNEDCFQPEEMNCLDEGFGNHWEKEKDND